MSYCAVRALVVLFLGVAAIPTRGAEVPELRVGAAAHAFDHLGEIGDQAETAAACGVNIIYATGLGGIGYLGLPSPEALDEQRRATSAYMAQARRHGIQLAIGYVCATSIVDLSNFDRHWPANLRSRFRRPPADWRQQGADGKPLPSWYGGKYEPACMNNPDWRAYEHYIVRQQLEAGCDGIFFDNPTVHPEGCYCRYCLEKFANYLLREGLLEAGPTPSLQALRDQAQHQPRAFQQFRTTIASDFLSDMREYARSIKKSALVTANNSLNSADVLYSQCRRYAYNIYELSRAEDFVVVEDMSSQPCTRADGRVVEYGPTYRQLHSLSHGKPVVAVVLAEADYHTPPHLVRLAMAEAAANRASYLLWPTWPPEQRHGLSTLIRPQTEFLRQHAHLLNHTAPRSEVVLLLPFRNWQETEQCRASTLAADLARANVQFAVICEDHLQPGSEPLLLSGKRPAQPLAAVPKALRGSKVLLVPSRYDLKPAELRVVERFIATGGVLVSAEQPDWLKEVSAALGRPAVDLQGAPCVRAVVQDQGSRTMLHLLNLDVRRLSSFQDQVSPVTNLQVTVTVPFRGVSSVQALTADEAGSKGPLPFSANRQVGETLVRLTVPLLEVSTIVLLEK